MSDQKVLDKVRDGKALTKNEVLYVAQRDALPGIPNISEVVDLEDIGGEQALQDALYNGTELEVATKKAKGKKNKEPSKADVEKAAKKSKVSPDPDDTSGYADVGNQGGAKVADTKPAADDDDD